MRRNLTIALCVAALAVGGWALSRHSGATGTAVAPGATLPQGAMVAVVQPASLSDTARMGRSIFDAACATCHGAQAAGKEGVAPPLVHKIYEPSHHGDESFQLAVQRGVRAHHWRFGDMPPVNGLTRADVTAIIDYVRSLQRANGIH